MVDPEDLDTRLRELFEAKEIYLDEWDSREKHALESIMPGSEITTEVLLKVAGRDLQQTDTVFESFLPHDAIKTYLKGPETQTALQQIAEYFKPNDRKTNILYFTDPSPDCPPWLAIATIGGKKSRVQFYLQDGPLRSPPPWTGALLQGVQHTLSSQKFELSYHIPRVAMLPPKDFGLQLIKLVRTNRSGRQGPLEKCGCPYGSLQLDTAAGIRVYCSWEYNGEDFRLMWFRVTLSDQDEEGPSVEDISTDGDFLEASDTGEDGDSTDGDSTDDGSEYCPNDQEDDDHIYTKLLQKRKATSPSMGRKVPD